MSKTKAFVSLLLILCSVGLTGCKPKPFSETDISQSKVVLQDVLNAFAKNDVNALQGNFVPTATELISTVVEVKNVWFDTLKSVGVESASVSGYRVDQFDVVKNEPDRLTASVLYTGTYTFTATNSSKTYVCLHQVEVVFVKYEGKVLVGNLQQQGAPPSCKEVK